MTAVSVLKWDVKREHTVRNNCPSGKLFPSFSNGKENIIKGELSGSVSKRLQFGGE